MGKEHTEEAVTIQLIEEYDIPVLYSEGSDRSPRTSHTGRGHVFSGIKNQVDHVNEAKEVDGNDALSMCNPIPGTN